jgi:hypothetical protein
MPNLHLEQDEREWKPGMLVRRLESLLVAFSSLIISTGPAAI